MLFSPELLFSPEFVALPFDWNTLLYGAGLAGAAGVASVFTHEESGGPEGIDMDTLKERVAKLENSTARTLEENEELATAYAIWAAVLSDEGANLNEIGNLYSKAEGILKATLAQGNDVEIRRRLGGVYLAWGVALNDYDDLAAAINRYQQAIDVLKPLDDSGDGEAKYEIAGIKLNLGVVYRELSEYKKAQTTFDESFLAYRAVEKIGAMFDTRFFMAKVSVQQGNLLSEMGETLDKIVDAYNRAMRLFVEVIEDAGSPELERDLANVLLDRCRAIYEDCLSPRLESGGTQDKVSHEEPSKVIDSVLIDIGRGIELLEKQCHEGNKFSRYDLFYGLSFQGQVLCDPITAKYDEAKKILDRVISEFSDLCAEGDDMVLMQMAMVHYYRALVHLGLGSKGLSKQDCQKGSELVNQLLQSNSDDEAIRELKQQFQELLGQSG